MNEESLGLGLSWAHISSDSQSSVASESRCGKGGAWWRHKTLSDWPFKQIQSSYNQKGSARLIGRLAYWQLGCTEDVEEEIDGLYERPMEAWNRYIGNVSPCYTIRKSRWAATGWRGTVMLGRRVERGRWARCDVFCLQLTDWITAVQVISYEDLAWPSHGFESQAVEVRIVILLSHVTNVRLHIFTSPAQWTRNSRDTHCR